MYRDRFALFPHGLYFANEAFLKIKFAMISMAIRDVGTGEILIGVGQGDDGKGMVGILEEGRIGKGAAVR